MLLPGLWMSFFALGNFVGPTVGGILVENYGFVFTSAIFFNFFLQSLFMDIFRVMLRLCINLYSDNINMKRVSKENILKRSIKKTVYKDDVLGKRCHVTHVHSKIRSV